ncbi:MAG TPA: YvcK family protein [Candidatus Rifleibacterium sp.]|nr:YvcK family protein [Candidatus Rifleibacterium sp.]HPT46673.1 YvcK family protein [Candidatus Rifleibacterium sp.]
MLLSLRRKISHEVRARRWVAFLLLGLLMMCFGFVFASLATIVLAPASIETIRSFHPLALAFSALSAFLISSFWLYRGFKTAFRLLDSRDHGLSTRLREFVFQKIQPAEKLMSLVALGGGTGLSSLLKGLKELPLDLTAIVTVTDDGGSSGRLRKELQILPPGDIRNCLVALSRSESLLSRLFQYRFGEGGEIEGHSFGNLFIAAMTGVIGDFSSAVREASSILAIKGHVVPVTNENVQLMATFADGSVITGETAICDARRRIVSMALSPASPAANQEALSAIDDANIIVLGPGSLFTSVIPNLLVPGVAEHINNSSARVVYICNVMTQPGETDSFNAADHVHAILEKTPLKRIDIAVVNSRRAARPLMSRYENRNQFWVPPTVKKIEDLGIRVVAADMLLESDMLRHNPNLLGALLFSLISEDAAQANEPPDQGADENDDEGFFDD